jgi:hypothetical protein
MSVLNVVTITVTVIAMAVTKEATAAVMAMASIELIARCLTEVAIKLVL